MSVIGLFSVKGSPGASTLALALAAHGREQGAVLIEADTAGGDAALRFGIPQHPGLAQFAARARQINARRDVLDGLARTIEVDGARPVDLVAAPIEPAAVDAAVTALHAQPDALATAGRGRTLVLDLGRLDRGESRVRADRVLRRNRAGRARRCGLARTCPGGRVDHWPASSVRLRARRHRPLPHRRGRDRARDSADRRSAVRPQPTAGHAAPRRPWPPCGTRWPRWPVLKPIRTLELVEASGS